MSRFKKVLLASALVVVGFGVAMFLGQPVLPSSPFASHGTYASQSLISTQVAGAASPGRFRTEGASLLPDVTANPSPVAVTRTQAAISASPLGHPVSTSASSTDVSPISEMPRLVDSVPNASLPASENRSPRARLRNEAPRAIGIDPQSPVAIRRVPPGTDVSGPSKLTDVPTVPARWQAPLLLDSVASDTKPLSRAAVATSFTESASGNPQREVAPPPWPQREDKDIGPRTHVVVDGDSLERIASRYLSDPARSHEIYELNRDVLTSPDLLPIGAELKIPPRVAAPVASQGFQPNSGTVLSNREMIHENWVPTRPVATQEIIPRAQLAPPVMVQ
ncbi:MAG TPA: LysM domain-containing protein [Lacipirellulaceae bacterium]|nr:LysM domain-containing protein [Lacipirellulaceae bacterium]